MKLKNDFITQDIEDTQYLISVGAEMFNGIVKSNKTAAYIVNLLHHEMTEAEIVQAMCDKYDAPRDVIAADVKVILDTLRGIRALEE